MGSETTENKVGREVMRLLKISRETAEHSVLDEALAEHGSLFCDSAAR